MAIEGQLSDVGLADIMQLLAVGRKTGCLTVTDRSNFGYIYLDDGRVIYANVLNRPDRLGELLVRNGVIDREELSEAMEQQARDPGHRLGRILVNRGAISEEQLHRYITIQIEEAVYHLFSWERGSFHFEAGARPEPENASHVSINAESLLLEGARRVDEWSLIAKKIPSLDLVFTLDRRPGSGDEVELTREQEKLLDLVDGVRTVRDIADESGLVEFDATKALYGLVQAGFARRTGRRDQDAPFSEGRGSVIQHLNVGSAYYRTGMHEDAEREYLAAIELDAREPTAHRRLALIALRTGRPEEALARYDDAPEEVRESVAGLRNRALILEMLDRPKEALALLERATEHRPENPELTLATAIVSLKAGDLPAARALFARYRADLPSGTVPPPLYYAFVTLALAAVGDADAALLAGREGLARHPSDGAVLVNFGVILEERGETAAAEALYLRAVSESPSPPQAHRNLGDLAYARGDQAGARAHFERAIRLDPELGDDVYLKLGNISHKEGDREEAAEHWGRALALNPRNEVARTNLELVATSGTK